MNPRIEAAWIAGSSGFLGVLVGVMGTTTVARTGFKTTRAATDTSVAGGLATVRAQIEADRQSRIWDKRADTYTDFVAVIQHRQDVREVMWREIVTGAELGRPAATLDASRASRPPAFDAVATRYDKRDFVWRGTVDVASIRIWLRHPDP